MWLQILQLVMFLVGLGGISYFSFKIGEIRYKRKQLQRLSNYLNSNRGDKMIGRDMFYDMMAIIMGDPLPANEKLFEGTVSVTKEDKK